MMPTASNAENEYDKLGQLKKKEIGTDPSNSSNPLETLNYEYNIRGWILGMNRDYARDTYMSAKPLRISVSFLIT